MASRSSTASQGLPLATSDDFESPAPKKARKRSTSPKVAREVVPSEALEMNDSPVLVKASRRRAARSPTSPVSISPPVGWRETWEIIVELRKDRTAVVDSMGSESISGSAPEEERAYHVLVRVAQRRACLGRGMAASIPQSSPDSIRLEPASVGVPAGEPDALLADQGHSQLRHDGKAPCARPHPCKHPGHRRRDSGRPHPSRCVCLRQPRGGYNDGSPGLLAAHSGPAVPRWLPPSLQPPCPSRQKKRTAPAPNWRIPALDALVIAPCHPPGQVPEADGRDLDLAARRASAGHDGRPSQPARGGAQDVAHPAQRRLQQ
eukprot:scaffold7843_cov108-Isochrysis_galbana.AAC.1